MTMYWVYEIPNWLFGTLCIGAFVVLGLAGLFATRRWVRRIHGKDHSHNDIVGYYLAAVTVFYGITLGLVAVGTWNTYSSVENKVDEEAQVVASLYRDCSSYPEPQRTALELDIKSYLREVIDHSWAQQRRGIIPVGSAPMVETLQRDLISFKPHDMGEQVLHAEAYKKFNELVEVRRARLDSVTSSLPKSLWMLVILGAVISIAVTLFFDTASFQMHFWMTILLSGLLGLLIFLIGTLDNPFRGKVSVSPIPLVRVYQQINR